MHLPNNKSGGGDCGGGGSNNSSEPDFSEFMWMAEEDLEAFDHKVLCEVSQVVMEDAARLRDDEEEFLCRMLQEEEERDTVYFNDYYQEKVRNGSTAELAASMEKMGVEDVAAKSTLNPHAAEFVPKNNLISGAATNGRQEGPKQHQ